MPFQAVAAPYALVVKRAGDAMARVEAASMDAAIPLPTLALTHRAAYACMMIGRKYEHM